MIVCSRCRYVAVVKVRVSGGVQLVVMSASRGASQAPAVRIHPWQERFWGHAS